MTHDVDLVGREETLIARHRAVQVLIQFVLQIGLIDAILVRTVVVRVVVEFVRADGREKISLSSHGWNEVPVGHHLRVVLAYETHRQAVGIFRRFVVLGRFETRLLGGILRATQLSRPRISESFHDRLTTTSCFFAQVPARFDSTH